MDDVDIIEFGEFGDGRRDRANKVGHVGEIEEVYEREVEYGGWNWDRFGEADVAEIKTSDTVGSVVVVTINT